MRWQRESTVGRRRSGVAETNATTARAGGSSKSLSSELAPARVHPLGGEYQADFARRLRRRKR